MATRLSTRRKLLYLLLSFSDKVVIVFMTIPFRAAFGQLTAQQQVMVLLLHATPLLQRQEGVPTIGDIVQQSWTQLGRGF